MHQVAAIAVALKEASTPEFRAYATPGAEERQGPGRRALMELGCSLVTNGTDNHLMLLDTMKSFGKSGKDVQELLESAGITLNKNAIAGRSPCLSVPGQRRAPGNALLRHPRHARAGDAAHRRVDCSALQRRKARAAVRDEVRALCVAHPTPSGLVEAGSVGAL
jgi:glycine hydroxymethyltransferase